MLGLDYTVYPVDIDESPKDGEPAHVYVQRLALEKVRTAAAKKTGIIIAADTTVALDQEILGKPSSTEEARMMLTRLSGKWHRVYTAIAVVDTSRGCHEVGYAMTEVKFANLNDSEIAWYINTAEPYDKAGAYAIQGYGSLFIEEIRGNYFNVVGLPVPLLKLLFAKLGLEKLLFADQSTRQKKPLATR